MRYPEVQDAVTHGRYESALDHYIHEGSNLLHDPCDFFVSRYYLEQAKYLDGFSLRKLPRSKQSTLLWHYLTVGLPQGKEPRSEEHTSELQSLMSISYAVFCLKINTSATNRITQEP